MPESCSSDFQLIRSWLTHSEDWERTGPEFLSVIGGSEWLSWWLRLLGEDGEGLGGLEYPWTGGKGCEAL